MCPPLPRYVNVPSVAKDVAAAWHDRKRVFSCAGWSLLASLHLVICTCSMVSCSLGCCALDNSLDSAAHAAPAQHVRYGTDFEVQRTGKENFLTYSPCVRSCRECLRTGQTPFPWQYEARLRKVARVVLGIWELLYANPTFVLPSGVSMARLCGSGATAMQL